MMSLYSGLGYGNFDSQFIAEFRFCAWLSILSDRLFHPELPKAEKGKTEWTTKKRINKKRTITKTAWEHKTNKLNQKKSKRNDCNNQSRNSSAKQGI